MRRLRRYWREWSSDLCPTDLGQNFPHLAQAITNLPAVTNGWNDVPGAAGATRFNGSPIKSGPDVRSYFSADVIPVQIGRASCRGRAEISGGALLLKKKNNRRV